MEDQQVEQLDLHRAVAQLDRDDRIVVVLKHFLGFTEFEVAEVLNISRQKVQRYDRRGLAQLRSQLAEVA